MVLELHVWGPAFGLPSIDTQYELPALRNGATWVSRFQNIVDYLKKYSAGHWDLDGDLNAEQRADNIAFSSLVESSAQPLLDLSLFVSTENYTSATRPAFSRILHFPQAWTVPPSLRNAAGKRSEHLGLSSLDVDLAAEEQKQNEDKQNHQAIPKSLLRKQKESLTGFLRHGAHRNTFKLEALTADLYEPFESLLGNKQFFLSETNPNSLDCLVIGYLSLALIPELPQEWMKRPLKSKFPVLAKYINESVQECFGPPISPSQVLNPEQASTFSESKLPWRSPPLPHFSRLAASAMDALMESIPGFASLRAPSAPSTTSASSSEDPEKSKRELIVAEARRRELISQAGAVSAGIGAFVGYLFWEGILKWPRWGAQRTSFGAARTFGSGAAEAMLGIGQRS
ncbi:MAG: hypothetical protein Q9227_007246 [Pyrenula ochraceoflavens]